METLSLHDLHQNLGARFAKLNGAELVAHYGDALREHAALRETAGILDLSFRSRICLTGGDRIRFLHGQVTNDVKALRDGEGCYAALITAKGKMQSDLNVYRLPDELLLDFEPGLTPAICQRLEKYVIADDVQLTDVGPLYGLLSVQGPQGGAVASALAQGAELPDKPFGFVKVTPPTIGEIYLVNRPRLNTSGFDLFVPAAGLEAAANRLFGAARTVAGSPCGWEALEISRIEAGIPRFGADMDETNIPLEAGLEGRAVSFSKGCYIGQEVISRIHTYGQVAKSLRGLRLVDAITPLPARGDKLFIAEKEVGYITSATHSPTLSADIALGYVRREVHHSGAELTVRTSGGDARALVVDLPFV